MPDSHLRHPGSISCKRCPLNISCMCKAVRKYQEWFLLQSVATIHCPPECQPNYSACDQQDVEVSSNLTFCEQNISLLQ